MKDRVRARLIRDYKINSDFKMLQTTESFDISTYELPADKVLVLRSCKPDMTAYGGFKWPEFGPVETPTEWNTQWGNEPTESDIKLCWDPSANCGGGLHGWLWAVGDYGLKVKDAKAKYLVVEVDASGIVQLDGKVKFQKGVVLLTGTFRQAYDLVMKWYWIRHAEKMKSVEVVEKTNSTTGRAAHSSTTGRAAHSSTTGYEAHSSTTGREAHSSTTGRAAHSSTTGDNSIACCLGNAGRAKCGDNGSIILTYWDGSRYRHKIGYAGENGIEPGKWYYLDSEGAFKEYSNA